MNSALLIFVKNPLFGKVKTRLAATVGNELALIIYQNLLKHTTAITQNLLIEKTVYYSDFIDEGDCWEHNLYTKKKQHGHGLGERMQHAFEDSFKQGKKEVILIGSDCIELSEMDLVDAFAHLKNYEVVIGPAKDGGYYLMGLKKIHTKLFQNINWSTDAVMAQTLAICTQLNLRVHLLPERSDIDEEKDIKEEHKKLLQLK